MPKYLHNGRILNFLNANIHICIQYLTLKMNVFQYNEQNSEHKILNS